MKAKIDGQWCVIVERGEYYTRVCTPLGEYLGVRNTDIKEEKTMSPWNQLHKIVAIKPESETAE